MDSWIQYRQQYLELFSLTVNGQNLTLKSKVLFPLKVKQLEVFVNQKYKSLLYKYARVNLSSYQFLNGKYRIPLINVINSLILIRKQIYSEFQQQIERVEIIDIKSITETKVFDNKNVFDLHHFFNNKLKKYIYSSFIQGSVATQDFTKFSDFDTFIILKKNTVQDIEEFISFMIDNIESSKYLYRFDPYQHHRNWICHQEDLNCYDQSILPVEVIAFGKSIVGVKQIKFNLIDSYKSIQYHANIGLISLRTKIDNKSYLKNMWYLKDFVSTALLIPAILLEMKNIYVYKKESFELAKNEFSFSDEEWKAISISTELRTIWTIDLNLKHQIARFVMLYAKPNPLLYQDVARKFGEKIPKNIVDLIHKSKYIYHIEKFLNKSSIIIKKNI